MFLRSKKYDPGWSSRIPDPDADFLPSRIQGSKRHPIPDPGSATLTFRVTFFFIVNVLYWVIGLRDNFFSSMGRNRGVFSHILILLLFSGTQNEPAVQMCSTSGQQCVFPFTYKGKTLKFTYLVPAVYTVLFGTPNLLWKFSFFWIFIIRYRLWTRTTVR